MMRKSRSLPRLRIDPYFTVGILSVLLLGTGYVWKAAQANPGYAMVDVPEALFTRLDGLALGYRLGAAGSGVRVVEIFDYQCPACAAAHRATWPMLKKHAEKGDLSYTVYDLPLPQHDAAVPAAMVAGCVAAQEPGHVWEYRHRVLGSQTVWEANDRPEDFFVETAVHLGLDEQGLKECMRTHRDDRTARLRSGWRAANDAGVHSIPTWEVNGRVVRWDQLETEVEKLLAARR
jgi:protein-disulfide isomerase